MDLAHKGVFTPAQVAEQIGCSVWTVYAEIREGRLKAVRRKGDSRHWYVKQEALDEWLEGGMWT